MTLADLKGAGTRRPSAQTARGNISRKVIVAQKRKRKTKRRHSKYSAKTADKHVLYQLSVQDTEWEVRFVDRIYKKLRKKNPMSLREDFCGTALMCAEWVKKNGRTATGVDIDRDTLAWGIDHNLSSIGEPGDRISLLEQDARDPVPGKFDVSLALNFSYFVFKTRDVMRGYFENVHRSMKRDGIFILDAYGGWEAMQPMEEPRKIKGGFTYVWDQDKVDAITNEVVNHIHFEFSDGTKMRPAFSYDWRHWSLKELTELLEEAGFSKSAVYWEDSDEEGEGTGRFRPKLKAANEPAWIAYIVAER